MVEMENVVIVGHDSNLLQKYNHEFLPIWNNERQNSGFNTLFSSLDRHKFYPGYNSGI